MDILGDPKIKKYFFSFLIFIWLVEIKKLFSRLASNSLNFRWNRTGSKPSSKNHASHFLKIFTRNKIKILKSIYICLNNISLRNRNIEKKKNDNPNTARQNTFWRPIGIALNISNGEKGKL